MTALGSILLVASLLLLAAMVAGLAGPLAWPAGRARARGVREIAMLRVRAAA